MEFKSDRSIEVEIAADQADKIWRQAFAYADKLMSDIDPELYSNYGELYDLYVFEYFSRLQTMTPELAETVEYYQTRAEAAVGSNDGPYELLDDDS